MYDIVIIGAGPAGSTLARMLDKKYKVLLVDKRNLIDHTDYRREKCCGGLLAPAAQKMFSQLGLGVPKDVLTGPQMFSVKSIDYDNNIERYYPRHYINIDREKLDRWLISIIPETVETAFNCIFKSYKEVDDYLEIELRGSNRDYAVKTKILVGADGAISRVRRQAFKDSLIPENYISIQEWYKTNKDMPFYTSIFDKAITDFYSWIIQKDDYLLIGSAIPIKADANERFSLLIEKLKRCGYIEGNAYKRTGTLIMRTRKLGQINAIKGKIALIGEAAGFISPSSAEGISYALKSGAVLAKCINKYYSNFGKEYVKKVNKIKVNIFIKNIKAILMYNKLTRLLIMKSRILSINISNGEGI